MQITSNNVQARLRGSLFGRALLVPAFTGFVGLAVAAPSCASPENRTIVLADGPDSGSTPPVFVAEDGGQATADPRELTQYCPTTSCPQPYTTCPTSQFPCDVNLMIDPKNCGSCGLECKGSNNAVFDCISGKCTFTCRLTGDGKQTADCNGIIDDDCEVTLGTNDNCSACGDRCSDPAKPCIHDPISNTAKCGCAPGELYCGTRCTNPAYDDLNCGACGVICNPFGNGGALPANARYGCSQSECDHLKCNGGYYDCDGDTENGCETSLLTNENCGACGKACGPGQTCRENPTTNQPECICEPGETLCGSTCANLLTDPRHCGACGVSCAVLGPNKNNVGTCNYGSCVVECKQGFGDCNGDPSDGCEVNLSSDQRNCGGCGRTCDALAGQPCIGGQCAVHPCGEGEGEAR